MIPDLMEKWEVPGGAIAVVKDGRLVLAKGYGLADVENEDLVQPDSMFRIASISKPVTAVAILNLVEEGLLGLDERAFDILDHLEPPDGAVTDPRVNEITVRQLLLHTGGWDRKAGYDPMNSPRFVTARLGVELPVDCENTIRFMLGQPLNFPPGTRHAYSNFGYCILGRIIEKKTGQTYEEYVQEKVLRPAGVTRMRIGGTTLEERAAGEVKYYDYPGASLAQSVLPEGPRRVPSPYGGFYVPARDSHGGWIASATDLARFVSALNADSSPPILEPETIQLMVSRPSELWDDEPYYYAMGWSVRPINSEANWWHAGALPGTRSWLVRTHHGMVWAALFNTWPEDRDFLGEISNVMWAAFKGVTTWPDHDLFPDFGYE